MIIQTAMATMDYLAGTLNVDVQDAALALRRDISHCPDGGAIDVVVHMRKLQKLAVVDLRLHGFLVREPVVDAVLQLSQCWPSVGSMQLRVTAACLPHTIFCCWNHCWNTNRQHIQMTSAGIAGRHGRLKQACSVLHAAVATTACRLHSIFAQQGNCDSQIV